MFGDKEGELGDLGTMDYSTMTVTQLKAEIVKLEKLIAVKTKETETQLLEELREKCAANGIDFESLVASARKPPKKKSQAKYKNPQNPSESWSGRGKKPNWVIEFLNSGGKLENLVV